MIHIYIINGYTRNVGQWEVELFRDKEKAENTFRDYVIEYGAEVSDDDDWYATCDDDGGWFSLEERTI